jgi:hypothetical protein
LENKFISWINQWYHNKHGLPTLTLHGSIRVIRFGPSCCLKQEMFRSAIWWTEILDF